MLHEGMGEQLREREKYSEPKGEYLSFASIIDWLIMQFLT
jgi:hypothetical protein